MSGPKDSAAYATWWCHKCQPLGALYEAKRDSVEAPGYVWDWVRGKVSESDYIWQAMKRCHGCCQVAELKCLVLGVLLYKLGVKVR